MIRGSAATSGTPIALPRDTPQYPTAASAPIQSSAVRASMVACHSGMASAAATTPRRANASPRGLPAAVSSSISALNGSYSAGTGLPPHPGASMAATAYLLPVT